MPMKPTTDWKDVIIKAIQNNDNPKDLKVNTLRKEVLKSAGLNKDDKTGKKAFKETMKELEEENVISIDAEGAISLLVSDGENKKKRKKDKKEMIEKKEKKKRKVEEDSLEEKSEDDDDGSEEETSKNDNASSLSKSKDETKTSEAHTASQKRVPCKGNPHGITRLFLGNLPFKVDENSLSEFLPDSVTHIKWITDKLTGQFYGSAFIEMDTPRAAAEAVAMSGSELMGRPLKVNFAPSRPGDVWPPAKKVSSGSGKKAAGPAGGTGLKGMRNAKPNDCVKLFCGNLSYDIDDEALTKFFDKVGAEVKAIRWISHRDTGDFKGIGFVEFWNTKACEKAATLNGKMLLGRAIRLDWTD